MITLLVILMFLMIIVAILLMTTGTLAVTFGWAIVIIADVVIGIWILVKIIKKIFGKKKN